jgi:hypothetical protein
MSSYVGPNGRLYKRERTNGVWLALTIVSMIVIATVILGLPNVAAAFRHVSSSIHHPSPSYSNGARRGVMKSVSAVQQKTD